MTSGGHPPRRPHWHAPEKGTTPAFLLSLFAHTLLFLSIAFVVRWKTEPVGTVSAELWGGFPAAAPAPAPAPVPVPEPVVEPPPPPPPPKVEREPEPERKADIVLEQKKKPEPPKKVEPPKEPPKKVEPPKPDLKKIEAQKREAAKVEAAKATAAKAEAAQAQQRREQELQRIAAAAGPSGSSPAGATGVSSGPAGGGFSRGYEGQVVGCIRPHIVFNVPDGVKPKQYVAEFEVQLLPTGEQATAPRLLKGSGLAAYDQAVERAIRRCDPFPRPREGAMPRSLRLTFDPVDTR
jgi:colicin import membrane protein